MVMAGKASPTVKYFQRQLGDAERTILLTAGRGDMSAGFLEVLDAYQHFYNLGLRPSMPLDCISLVIPQAQDNEAL